VIRPLSHSTLLKKSVFGPGLVFFLILAALSPPFDRYFGSITVRLQTCTGMGFLWVYEATNNKKEYIRSLGQVLGEREGMLFGFLASEIR